MRVYLFRHGETDWNAQKRLQGQVDIPLNQSGIDMAKKVSEKIKDIHFDYCFSSPLIRAVETARLLLGDKDVPIQTDDRLKEMGFGIDEGKPVCERTEGCDLFFTDPANYIPHNGGETIEEINARTRDFLESVLVPLSVNDPDATVLLSGHGGMNKSLLQTICKITQGEFWSGNFEYNVTCAIVEVKGNEYRLEKDFFSFLGETNQVFKLW